MNSKDPNATNRSAPRDSVQTRLNKSPKSSSVYMSMLNNTHQQIKNSVEKTLETMFNTADDSLFDLADKSKSDKERNEFFDAMRVLRLERPKMINRFLSNLYRVFESHYKKDTSDIHNGALGFDSWSLLEQDVLEESIAWDSLKKRLSTNNDEVLKELELRYLYVLRAALNQRNLVKTNTVLPFAPEVLVMSMKDASENLSIGINEKLVILKLFERAFLKSLPSFYKQLNQYLINQNIIPNINDYRKSLIKRQRQINHVENNTFQTDDSPWLSDYPVSIDSHLEQELVSHQNSMAPEHYSSQTTNKPRLFDKLRHLLSRKKPPTHSQMRSFRDGNYDALSGEIEYDEHEIHNLFPIDSERLDELLSDLQHNTPNLVSLDNIQSSVIDVRKNIARSIQSPQNALQFQPLADDVIELVNLFFQFVLADKNVPDEIKVMICRLQIPVLKIAIADQSLFSSNDHPARRLVNLMAKSSVGWDGKSSIHGKAYYELINRIVGNIVDNFEQDVGIFVESLNELKLYLDKEAHKAKLIEKRMQLVEEGKAKKNTTEKQINDSFDILTKERKLAPELEYFYQNYYRRTMLILMLKHGFESPFWKNLISNLNLLIWSTQDDLSSIELEKRDKVKTKLFSNIEHFCQLTGIVDLGYKTAIINLKKIFDSRSKKTPRPVAVENQSFANRKKALTINIREVYEKSLKDNAHKEKINTNLPIKVGSWVEMLVKDESVRCKLAASIKHYDRHIFVNRAGMKVADLTTKSVLEALEAKEIRVFDDTALFDRALESVISNLRELKAANQ